MKFTILILALVFAAFGIYYLQSNPSYCGGISYCEDLGINGLIVAKYLDYKNHGYRTVSVKERGDEYNQKNVTFITDTSGIYNSLVVGDYIQKKKGSFEVSIIHGSKIYKKNFKCICN